jgi:hypothetical protein
VVPCPILGDAPPYSITIQCHGTISPDKVSDKRCLPANEDAQGCGENGILWRGGSSDRSGDLRVMSGEEPYATSQ